jgi:hypothetical protein
MQIFTKYHRTEEQKQLRHTNNESEIFVQCLYFDVALLLLHALYPARVRKSSSLCILYSCHIL